MDNFITPWGYRAAETDEWRQVKEPYRLYLVTVVGASDSTVYTYLRGAATFARSCEQEADARRRHPSLFGRASRMITPYDVRETD